MNLSAYSEGSSELATQNEHLLNSLINAVSLVYVQQQGFQKTTKHKLTENKLLWFQRQNRKNKFTHTLPVKS